MNQAIFYFFYNLTHQSVFFDKIIVFFAVYFPYIVVVLAGVFLLFHHKVLPSSNPLKELISKWKEFLYVFFSCIGAWLVAVVLKTLFHTPRPFLALPDVSPLFSESGFAFPSQHALFFTALAVSLFFVNKKVGYIFMFFAFLIGLARVTAGVHFPIDILGGFVLGALVAYFVKNV